MHKLTISTTKKQQIIDITSKVKNIIKKTGTKKGICIIYSMHTTAGLLLNENADPNICEDILNSLSNMVPNHGSYRHDIIDNNAAAHIQSALLNSSLALIIHDNAPVLGKWQAVMFCELDGPRERKVIVEVLKK